MERQELLEISLLRTSIRIYCAERKTRRLAVESSITLNATGRVCNSRWPLSCGALWDGICDIHAPPEDVLDSTWNEYENYALNNGARSTVGTQSISIPNPKNLGFDVCVPVGDTRVCVDNFMTGDEQTIYCGNGGTTVRKFGLNIMEVNIFNGKVQWDVTAWVAFSEYGCIYVGIDPGPACSPLSCPIYPSPADVLSDSKDFLTDLGGDILDKIGDLADDPIQTAGTVGIIILTLIGFIVALGMKAMGLGI